MVTLENNICADTDFYKLVHWKMSPDGLTKIYSYAEARTGAKFDYVKFMGLIPILTDYFAGIVVTQEKIEEAALLTKSMSGFDNYFNREMWEHILKEHGGKLPLEIRAVKEGTVVPVNNVLFTITSTDEKCAPLVNHCETVLMHIWASTTVATASHYIRTKISGYLQRSGTPSLVEFLCHDFGYRGVSSSETAMMCGMANLLNFKGTDTNIAERAIKHYYPKDYKPRAVSVWATEHSIATAFGLELEDEIQYVLHQLNRAPNKAILSIVGDSRDIYRFCSKVVAEPRVKSLILAREGRFVVRPDSGVPRIVVNKCLNLLGKVFGISYNDKDYKVINHNVGILQGDGMDVESICELYESIMGNDWSADNLAVGSGGGLMQKWNRDTQRFAIKASMGEMFRNGVDGLKKLFTIFKNPITANEGEETKLSKKGWLKLHKAGDSYSTISSDGLSTAQFNAYIDVLELVFFNGEIMVNYSFEEMINVDNGVKHNLNKNAA